MRVFEKIREHIVSNHLNQKAVAEAAHIPNVTFNAMLSGKKKMYAEDLRAVCFALNVSADTFIETKPTQSIHY